MKSLAVFVAIMLSCACVQASFLKSQDTPNLLQVTSQLDESSVEAEASEEMIDSQLQLALENYLSGPFSYIAEAEEVKPQPGPQLKATSKKMPELVLTSKNTLQPQAGPVPKHHDQFFSLLEENLKPASEKYQSLLESEEDLKPASEKYQPALLELEQINTNNDPNRPNYVHKTNLPKSGLTRYNWVVMFTNAFDDIVFQGNREKLRKAHDSCIMSLVKQPGFKEKSDTNIQKGWNKFWEFCYKPDPEATLFDIIHTAADVYQENMVGCHDQWGLEGLETLMGWFDDFQNKLHIIEDKHKKAQKVYDDNRTLKFKYDAWPGELVIQQQLKQVRDDKKVMWQELDDLTDKIEAAGDMHQELFSKREQTLKDMGEEDFYEAWKATHKEDWLQLIQITAEHADFFCREEEALADHFGRTLKIYKQLLDGWAAVMDGDTFP